MSRHNTQMFALAEAPPAELVLKDRTYRRVRVFKHDFFAATSLYESAQSRPRRRIVVKLYRTRSFCGFGMAWAGRLMRSREHAAYRRLRGVRGVPDLIAPVGPAGLAVRFVEARPLDRLDGPPPPGFFDRLRRLFDEVHARGVAYGDANKRSNILCDAQGQPHLVDFQVAMHLREDWPRPARAVVRAAVRRMQRADLYHLYKHKRRLRPDELTEAERLLSRRRGALHALHRRITDPWRLLRRSFLRRQHRSGRLVSPTADLEDLPQPEKASWRTPNVKRQTPNAKR